MKVASERPDFLQKKDMEALLELSEVPQLKDQINRVIKEKYSFLIGSFYFYASDNKVVGFGFQKTDLKQIPEPIFKFDSLRNLHVENNRFTEIPDSISRLKNLRELYVCSNKIKKIYDSINKLELI